jgi:spore maturation protein CgeB
MKDGALRIVVLGLSLSSSWGNGHATTYRALLKAMAARGHRILFLERDQPWYAAHRDLTRPDYCQLRFYKGVAELRRWQSEIVAADAVIVGSYVPSGIHVGRFVQRYAAGVTAFYDIDTPVTLAKIEAGEHEYLTRELIPGFDLYLSFTGGPTLRRIEKRYGAPMARALYCSVDPQLYRRTDARQRWDLGYLGTYSADRQGKLEKLLLEPARRAPSRRFVVAGAQYPADIDWPPNVERIDHLPPSRHADFYSSLGWTLNLTRADMVQLGYSPSVRLFEAGACATPIISDRWTGLDEIFELGTEVAIAESERDIAGLLACSSASRVAIGRAAQRRVHAEHTAAHRAGELEGLLREARARVSTRVSAAAPALDGAATARLAAARSSTVGSRIA